MPDFWQSCGYRLLERGEGGRLAVTDDYLRMYYQRAELAPVPQSCAAERALHERLLEAPRREVSDAEIDAMADEDARENYRVVLRFRSQLLARPTLEAFTQYAYEQGVTARKLQIDELFAPETRESFKI